MDTYNFIMGALLWWVIGFGSMVLTYLRVDKEDIRLGDLYKLSIVSVLGVILALLCITYSMKNSSDRVIIRADPYK
jgi:hypothetical protein